MNNTRGGVHICHISKKFVLTTIKRLNDKLINGWKNFTTKPLETIKAINNYMMATRKLNSG